MKPLLSNEALEAMCSKWLPRLEHEFALALKIREIYEEDRRKRHELTQRLVDALHEEQFVPSLGPSTLTKPALADALAQGYKPSGQ